MKRTALMLLVLGWAVVGVGSPTARGQEYGAGLDGPERQAMTETLQHTLEYGTTGQESSWVNPDTGRAGALVPVQTYVNQEGQPCREFIQTIVIGGQEEQGYGTACRQPDGTWQIVGEAAAAGQVQAAPVQVVEKTSYVYVYRDPFSHYYPWVYHDPFFYPHRIFFSFVFVRHGGHFHHAHFHDGRRHFKGFKGDHRHFRGGDKGHFRVDNRHFRGDQRFRDNRHLRGDDRRFRGGDRHLTGDRRLRTDHRQFRGDQRHGRADHRQFRGDQGHGRADNHRQFRGEHRFDNRRGHDLRGSQGSHGGQNFRSHNRGSSGSHGGQNFRSHNRGSSGSNGGRDFRGGGRGHGGRSHGGGGHFASSGSSGRGSSGRR